MTFAVIADTATTTVSGASGGETINLPPNISSGDLLVFALAINDNGAFDFVNPSGWTRLFSTVGSGGFRRFGAFYKVASGSEGSTLFVAHTSGNPDHSAAVALRITGYTGTPECGTTASGSSTKPKPPSVTASWGSDDNLWLALEAFASGNATTPTLPTNYSNQLRSNEGSVQLSSCQRNNATATEDPGTFTIGTSTGWLAQTIVIRGISVVTTPVSVSITASGGVSLSKSIGKALAMASSATVSNLKRAGKAISLGGMGTVSVRKAVTKLLALITSTGTVALTVGRAFTKTVAITASGTVALAKRAGKIIAVTATGTVTLPSRAIDKIVALTSTAVLTVKKAVAARRTLVATGTTAVVKRIGKAVSQTATGTITVSLNARRVVIIAITAMGAVAFGPNQISKIITVAATGTGSFVKSIGKTIAAGVAGTVSFAFAFFRFITQPSSFGKQITAARSDASQITSDRPSTRTITDGKSRHTDITSSNPINRQITE